MTHVDDFRARQRALLHSSVEFEQLILALLSMMARLDGWCRRAQHDGGAQFLGSYDSHVASMVAWRLLLLVARVVLLIHDDQSRLFQRRKHRRARADQHIAAAGANALPDTLTLPVIK